MKILIVEDEPSLREMMQRVLTEEHYVVETAATYLEADDKNAKDYIPKPTDVGQGRWTRPAL